jgi:hypothetical protein
MSTILAKLSQAIATSSLWAGLLYEQRGSERNELSRCCLLVVDSPVAGLG